MVGLGDLQGDVAVAVLLGQTVDLVVEDVGEALQEQQRQQVVLELRRVLLAADRAGRVPEHLLHGLGLAGVRAAPMRRRRWRPGSGVAGLVAVGVADVSAAASSRIRAIGALCGLLPPPSHG